MPDNNSSEPIRHERTCTYDPLRAFIAHYADAKSTKSETNSYANMSLEEKLKARIVDGDKLGMDDDLKRAMNSYSALDIINTILLDGMKTVGELFGSGEMQLPFVLQSAETMKFAVKYLEPFMEKMEGEQSKGVIVLATVKGDVHDIGKNLVDIILTNNGYRVVNLGIKVSLQPMLDAVEREHADAIGMSGLLVKSTAIMKENLEVMESRGIRIPVVLGGAALTRKFVERDLRALYQGSLSYAQDAFDGLHFMERLNNPVAVTAEEPDVTTLSLEEMKRRMEEVRSNFLQLLDRISEEEFHIPGSFNAWTLRDVVAHLIGWERTGKERLEKIARNEPIEKFNTDQLNEINSKFVKEIDHAEKSTLIGTLEEARRELTEALGKLSEQDFVRDLREGLTLQKWLPHFTFQHEADHAEKVGKWIDSREEELDSATGAESKIAMASRSLPWMQTNREGQKVSGIEQTIAIDRTQEEIADYPITVERVEMAPGTEKLVRVSNTPHDNPIPTPPFWGSKTVQDIKLEKVWEYLNEVALFRGQWQIRKGKKSDAEYALDVENVARPKLNEMKLRAKRDRFMQPKVAYGYYPCYAEEDDLVVLKPVADIDTNGPWKLTSSSIDQFTEWKRFTFPRQPTARRLCLADFYLPKSEALRRDQPDVVAFTAVTVGREASEYTAKLFESNQYADYLFVHGLTVETAEALAEYWHKIIRSELGIGDKDAKEITRLFSQGYQGSRFSFGYPACPNLDDQTKLFDILKPERVGITLTEEFHLEPEQSTTALVCHHPAARYFSIK